MVQYKVGYIIDSVAKVITDFKLGLNRGKSEDQTKLDQINGLLQHVSSFDVAFPENQRIDYHSIHPVLATINNIITRGLPTRAPLLLESVFNEVGLTEQKADEHEINFSALVKEIKYESIYELLHIIEPELVISREDYGGNLGSEGEWNFLHTVLKNYPFVKQIFQSQRDFATINKKLVGGKSVDFSFEFPYLNAQSSYLKKKGVIFEFDGLHHKIKAYKYYDKYRDDAADEMDFETLRQPSDEVVLDKSITNQFKTEIFSIYERNFLKNVKECLVEYSLLFIPLAVARIQKTVIEYLLYHPEIFNKSIIEMAIVERDLPCGAMAIKSLQELFFHINAMLEDKDKLVLPEISLTVFENPKWVIDSRLHLQAKIGDEILFQNKSFDIIIDHSVLRRSSVYNETSYVNEGSIKIRSSHFFDTSFGKGRRVYCADLLHYKSLVVKEDDGSYASVSEYENHINYFIKTIFRKISFREGQLPIISRALQLKPVIGLLPTGGGKSLTFQLPVFLQPGLCLVVDPIKSLMEDQVRVLKQHWIDSCDFINSNLKREDKVKKLIDFRFGETMFLYVSPERFVMQDFRNIMNNIDASKFGLAFSYCVIDEVHCVSEWGHDFRSTYLMLGKNAQKFAKTKNNKAVTLIGLTATASFDVLADIERELQIQHDDIANAIIMIENTIRPELFFRVIDVTGKDRMKELNTDFAALGTNLDKINREEILKKSQQHHFDAFEKRAFATSETRNFIDESKIKFEYDNTFLINEPIKNKSQNDFFALIFCPTKGNGRSSLGEITDTKGVPFVFEKLSSMSKGFFYASDEMETKEEIQYHFENFIHDKSKHIVCTKAFGMGIDKKDIRSTYHYFYSGSLESLVQEAGRSGRDKKISEANILLSKSKYVTFDVYRFFSENQHFDLIQNGLTRKAIRQGFEKKWENKLPVNVIFSSIDEAVAKIDLTDFSLFKADGSTYNRLPAVCISELRNKLKEKDAGNAYRYLTVKYEDRNMHDFFHELSFKGVETEKSQCWNMFFVREFQVISGDMVYIDKQDSLAETFENCQVETFEFLIAATKKYPELSEIFCQLFEVIPDLIPPFTKKTNKELIIESLIFSRDFNDFLFNLEEKNVVVLSKISAENKADLLNLYSRDRKKANDTGRLIYRLHSMGFLEDYLIDYNKNNLYICTFRKFDTIDKYVIFIEHYLRRYLSENTAVENIEVLKSRLIKLTLLENIMECLYFLAEFSYREIASKRKRATDEIESILNTSITDPLYISNWFKQNIYIKEQIYFYFNAKYARIGFKINGKPFSLLDDYKEQKMNKQEILDKYLKVFREDGTEQNNYKHMMGSCKKILRSLSDTDLNKEWLLRLLKAFSMYAVNNASYTSEANADLELGFDNLYKDYRFHHYNIDIIEPIFISYFSKLQENVKENNPFFDDIKLIRAKLLLKLQALGIEKLLTKYNLLKA